MKMEKLKKCRICLVENVRMFVVANKNLQEIYEKLTDVPFLTEDSRPMLACFFCYAKLKQCYQLQRKCLEAEELFAQMLNEDYETKLLLKPPLEFFSGFVITPTVHISIVDEIQTDSIAIKEELAAVCEGLNDNIGLKEEHQSELKQEYQDKEYVDNFINISPHYSESEDIQPHRSESDSEDNVPLMEFKTEVEVKEQVYKRKRTGSKAKRTPVAKKPKRSVRRPILEDTITAEQNNIEQPASEISCNTQKCTSKPVTKFKKPFTNTKPLVKNRINKETQNDGMDKHGRLSVKEKSFKCDICERCFKAKADLKNHIRSHSGERPFRCDICGLNFLYKNNLTYHILVHKGKKVFECDICQRVYPYKNSLINHIRVHTGEKPFQCDICGHSFRHINYLMNHIRVHTGEKPFQCDICGHSYKNKKCLITHIRVHIGEKPFQCDICKRSFSEKGTLKRHVIAHTDSKPYKCEICNRSFSKIYLKRHSLTHTGVRPHKCEICQRSFNEKNKLANHMRQHTGEKPFKCDICQESFCVRSSLNRHILWHADKKPYKCEICQRSFRHSSDLKRHNLIHTGEKPFQCEICQKSFTQRSTLNVHRRTHKKERKT